MAQRTKISGCISLEFSIVPYNNAQDMKTEIDNTLRVSLAFLVKFSIFVET